MPLNPKTAPLPSGKIEMTWTPDPTVFGYRFYRDGTPVSKGSNALQDKITFGAETDGKSHAYGIGSSLMPTSREDSIYPPIPPSQLGALLLAKYPPPAPPTAGVFKINSFDEFMNAWANPVSGADYDGQGKTFSGPAKDYFYRANPAKPPRFRNAAIEGGARLMVAGSNLSLGNTMKEPLRIKGGRPDCLKFDSGSKIYWDGLILEDSPGQGLLAGSGSGPTVTDIRGINWITRRNGTNTNKDHNAYLANVLRFCFANWLTTDPQAYCGQFYPQCRDGMVVNVTGSGGKVRGGFVYGSESSNPDPTKMIRNIGCMSTFADYWSGWGSYRTAPGCTVEDSQAWDVAGPDVQGLTSSNVLNADPLFVDRAAGDYRPRHSVLVREVNWGWLYPTDLYGNPRGPHAGALALAA